MTPRTHAIPRETCTRHSRLALLRIRSLLLALARSGSDVVLRHAPRQASDVVLQGEVLALQPVVVVAHELDAFGDLEQTELGLAGVSGWSQLLRRRVR